MWVALSDGVAVPWRRGHSAAMHRHQTAWFVKGRRDGNANTPQGIQGHTTNKDVLTLTPESAREQGVRPKLLPRDKAKSAQNRQQVRHLRGVW